MMDARDITQMNALVSLGTQAAENDSTGRVIYIGYAEPGTSKGSAKWQIRKLTYDANGAMSDVQFANGSNEFKFEWDERATYTYS